MKPAAKAFAIITSIIIVMVCLIFALTLTNPLSTAKTDITQAETLKASDRLEITTTLSGVTITLDSDATDVTAHLYGSAIGFQLGGEPKLTIIRTGDTVTIRARRQGIGSIGWNNSMKLDIVIPASFTGELSCDSSAGALNVNADLVVKSLRLYTTAGSVKTQNIKSDGSVDVSTSAGSVETGDIEASKAIIHSSAGRVDVPSCKAADIKIDSSAGGVTAHELSGKVKVSSSAGSVDVTLKDVLDSADISSSAGRVDVTLPANSNANINASTSAGSVSINNLSLTDITQDKRSKVIGKLGTGGPEVKVHSSAGSVEVKGR